MLFVATSFISCPCWSQPSPPQEDLRTGSLFRSAHSHLKEAQDKSQWDFQTKCMAQTGTNGAPNQSNIPGKMDPNVVPPNQEPQPTTTGSNPPHIQVLATESRDWYLPHCQGKNWRHGQQLGAILTVRIFNARLLTPT